METSKTSRKQRLEEITAVFILRRTEDAQRTQPDVEVAKARAISYERHLTNMGVKPEDYNAIYEQAVLAYVEKGVKGPFGIDEILHGVTRFRALSAPVKAFTKEHKIKVTCVKCDGTGLKFENGKILYGEDKKALKCTECNGQ